MDNLIKSVIDIDKLARLRAEDVKAFRDNAIQQLEQQKQELIKTEDERTDLLIAKNAAACEAKMKKTLEKLSADENTRCAELDDIYSKHRDSWIKDIVKEVISF